MPEFKLIRENWMILVLITTMVIWYANVNSRLNTLEKTQAQQQVTLDKVNTLITDIAVIKSNVETIKENLKK